MTAISWGELVAQATLGTARRPQAVRGTVLGAPLPPAGSTERSLLAAAAALGAARRVSTTSDPGPGQAPVATAPRDGLPVVPPRAGQLLEVILGGEVVQAADAVPLLQAWLQACADTGHRVSPDVLTRLLPRTVGARLDPLLTGRAIGARGRWLAGRNPAWAAVAQPLLDADVEALRRRIHGPARLPGAPSRPEALAMLRRRRQPDDRHQRDDLAATTALTDLWQRAGAAERQAILAVAAETLQGADEPWLERALDDDAAAIRHGAATLLARLPDSRRAARMADRLRAITEVSAPALGLRPRPAVRLRRRLVVDRPSPPTSEALRDASEPAPAQGIAEWWQAQILRGARVRTWAELLGGVDRAAALLGDHSGLLHAVADAAALQRDPAWQEPLLHALLGGVGLGPAELEQIPATAAAQADRQARADRVAAIGRLAGSLAPPWDRRTSRALLDWILAHPTPGPVLAQLRPVLAGGLAPDLVEVLRGHEGYNGSDARQVVLSLSRLRHVLSLRSEIASAFDATDPAR